MERFIDLVKAEFEGMELYLKSSMERFIVFPNSAIFNLQSVFKIQYGEIYRYLI